MSERISSIPMKIGMTLAVLGLLGFALSGCGGIILGIAAFSGNPTAGVAALTVQFTDQSTGTPLSWLWDFGDGTQSVVQHPIKVYTAAGIYTVRLTVGYGYAGSSTETKTDYIKVGNKGVGVPGATHTTLAAAVAAASPGDIIVVGDGTYTGPVTVTADGVTIVAASRPILDGDLTVNANNVTVRGLKITGKLETTPGSFQNLTLVDTQIYGVVFNTTLSCNDVVNVGESIQTAIGLVGSGATICVAPGTHTEGPQIVINKNLTIAGFDKTTTIIKPASDTGSSGDARGWFLVNTGFTFNLSRVTLDGTGRKVFQAIRHRGVGTISDCAFVNIQFEPSGPSYAGFAIVAFDVAGNVDVTNCTFSGIGRVGVLFFGSGKLGTYSDNTYTGKGIGDWLDYGVEVGGGAHATISNNTISKNRGVASVDGSTSAGILVTTYYGAGTQATITGNTLTDNTKGIAVGYDASDTSTVEAHFNNITGNDTGVSSTAPLVNAENNWWGAASGPLDTTGTNEVPPCTADPATEKNADGTGDKVSDNVDYCPWATSQF